MNVDVDAPERGKKRDTEGELASEGHKKARFDRTKTSTTEEVCTADHGRWHTTVNKCIRDRENSVFVAELPAGITKDELNKSFKNCGSVREVKITQLSDELVVTVEFFQRDRVPAALIKDKKRLRDQEVAVHLGWKSTLYVTNFPASADDTHMRN